MISPKAVTELRLRRQHLLRPADEADYDALFADCSPVPTEAWCEPGSPPTLSGHAAFDDGAYNFARRSRREILKGRFGGGTVAYVLREDLELFACLYRKEPPGGFLPDKLLELLRREGPMNIGLMREFSGLPAKEITPALHKLQMAFLLYEDQLDNDWDRGWFLFADEFPDVRLDRYTRVEALAAVLPRFARRSVFFGEAMARSFYQVPAGVARAALHALEQDGTLTRAEAGGQAGWMLPEDRKLLEGEEARDIAPFALLLPRNDFWVRANAHTLKERFPPDGGFSPLYYVMVDGELRGAVYGRFKFGPHVVSDIVLELPPEECARRRDEIFAATALRLDPRESPPQRYCGERLPQPAISSITSGATCRRGS